MGFLEAFRDGYSVGAAGDAILANRATPCIHWYEAILLYGPFLQTIALIITLESKDVGDGNPFRARKAIATISAEPFSHLSHPIHKYANLF